MANNLLNYITIIFDSLLYKKCLSHEDLTTFARATRQREDDIESGKVDPYNSRREKIGSPSSEVRGLIFTKLKFQISEHHFHHA